MQNLNKNLGDLVRTTATSVAEGRMKDNITNKKKRKKKESTLLNAVKMYSGKGGCKSKKY